MQRAIIHFVITALLGLGIGYLAFDVIGGKSANKNVASPDTTTSEPANKSKEAKTESETETVSADSESILSKKGCIGCHSVEKLNLSGGATGPDLSQAYVNVEGKHGKPINEFLKEPTSAVMSGVIGGNPLSDAEITEIVDLLKTASEK